MTPEQYVKLQLIKHPTLYVDRDMEKVRIKVYDQLFNTIGNGIRCHNDLLNEIGSSLPEQYDKQNHHLYLTEQIYFGFYNISQCGDLVKGVGPFITCIDSYRSEFPNIIYWEPFKYKQSYNQISLYPNFQKRYSLVYRYDFLSFGNEWITAAIEYYQYALKYFTTELCNSYSMYTDDNTNIDTLHNYIVGKYTNNDEVSKAYGVDFIGNIHDIDDIRRFAITRWNIERKRILQFINETLDVLIHNLDSRI